jgi:hypothetical protein
MMATDMVPETAVFNKLTWLISQKESINEAVFIQLAIRPSLFHIT